MVSVRIGEEDIDIGLLESKKFEVGWFFIAKFERADEWDGMYPEPLPKWKKW